MRHDMTLRGVKAGLVLMALAGCYGNPQIGGHDAGADGAGGTGTGGSDSAGKGGGSGSGGTSSAGRGGQGGSSAGAAGSADRGGASGVGGAGGSDGPAGGVGGVGGLAGSAGSVAGGGSGGLGGSAGGGSACSPACDATHTCTGGRCLLADAQQCVTASQCGSGACNPFYADVDGDGYGTGQPVGYCTLTAPPIGYATQNGDCCDDATNIAVAKLIHPGADFQLTSAGGICGITWDYDCSGKIDSNPKTIVCSSDAPSCTYTSVNYADSSCGGTLLTCGCALAGSNCNTVCTGTPGKVSCK